jgi:isopentenyl diphosphate isomerase/L-lactate dehydrogenase-like FMN-dependent dehydrogenase
MPHDDELTRSLLQHAVDSGFTALLLTLDTWQLGWRHDDVATSNYAFYHGFGADLGLSDPILQKRHAEKEINPKAQPNEAGAMWIDNVWHGRAHTWEKAVWAMELWKELSGGTPFCLKGIQSVEDARMAVEKGFDGIVVSNHAGRQVDGAVPSLDALEKIVDGRSSMYYSAASNFIDTRCSCWRQNIHHVRLRRAFRLGCLQSTGTWRQVRLRWRLWIWGLSIMGEAGVLHVMRSLLADLDILMNVAGFQNIRRITREAPETGPKDYSLMNVSSRL